jgi:hypothetical protein
MKPSSAIIAAMSLVVFLAITSCDNKANTTLSPAGNGFELADIGDQTVKQSDHDNIRVSIDRKGSFTGDVTVEISGLPAGVQVDGGNKHVILAKDSSITLKVMAGDGSVAQERNDVRVTATANVDGKTLSKTDNFNLAVKPR